MKSIVILLAALVAFTTANNVLVDKNQLKCFLCEMMVQDSDKWLGKEGQKDEGKAITFCENLLQKIGQTLDQIICEAFVKDELDNIIAELNDPSFQVEEAGKVCHKLKYC